MSAPYTGLRGRPLLVVDRRALTAVAAPLAMVLIMVVGSSVVDSGRHNPHRTAKRQVPRAPLSPSPATAWKPVTPLTVVPPDTAVQQQYDAAFASGLSASPSLHAAEAAQVPGPAFSPSWPALAEANTPEQWSIAFARQLLDIDFAHQSRADLGRWLSAEEAPELLPGIPRDVADKVLYLSLFDANEVGGSASPIPDPATWHADAVAGVRWSVSDLVVQADPQFSQILATGWEPVDQRFAAEDVSGLLTVKRGDSPATKPFSMGLFLGSAHWHPGYGTVLVDNWKEG